MESRFLPVVVVVCCWSSFHLVSRTLFCCSKNRTYVFKRYQPTDEGLKLWQEDWPRPTPTRSIQANQVAKSHPNKATMSQFQAPATEDNMVAPLHSSQWAMCVMEKKAQPEQQGLTMLE